ncbi:MAG TPA: hypothetical protein VHU81_07830 [Thermoanaerobaculia bacterium]|jgi:hypothetical protein|nr:hypothetical protein [Thermoanaerobaculia bacterium]
MKKQKSERILGRRVAREMSQKDLENVNGAAVATWTLRYPADGPYADNSGGGIYYV